MVRRLGISKHVHYCKRKCDTIFVIFLLRCLKPLLPKFQRLSVVCLVTGGNTRTEFFPLACLANAGVGFVAVDFLIFPSITLGPTGLFLFFWWRSCDSRDRDCTLDKNYSHLMFTQIRRSGFDEWLFRTQSQLRHENKNKSSGTKGNLVSFLDE